MSEWNCLHQLSNFTNITNPSLLVVTLDTNQVFRNQSLQEGFSQVSDPVFWKVLAIYLFIYWTGNLTSQQTSTNKQHCMISSLP